jgi:bifunctional UDP-N-acetylglucosamine pyrophosphorylase/glucosamine-1-phosphate N-acetyltransferase
MDSLQVIVLGGGEGKRMKSDLPKVLHMVNGKSMIERIITKVNELPNVSKTLVVSGKNAQVFEDKLSHLTEKYNVKYVPQTPPQGTGHAVSVCLPYLDDGNILIVNGDTPLIDDCLSDMISCQTPCLMVTNVENPKGQGRIVKDNSGKFEKIVEEKDASEIEKKIGDVNCGIYFVTKEQLVNTIPNLNCSNAQNEYYLTDICEMLKDKLSIYTLSKSKQCQILNVNTPDELALANTIAVS